jgi:hypothetical protein
VHFHSWEELAVNGGFQAQRLVVCRMGLQGLLLVLGAALLQLPTSSFAQQAETAHTHEHYVEIAKQRKLMHQMVRETLKTRRF